MHIVSEKMENYKLSGMYKTWGQLSANVRESGHKPVDVDILNKVRESMMLFNKMVDSNTTQAITLAEQEGKPLENKIKDYQALHEKLRQSDMDDILKQDIEDLSYRSLQSEVLDYYTSFVGASCLRFYKLMPTVWIPADTIREGDEITAKVFLYVSGASVENVFLEDKPLKAFPTPFRSSYLKVNQDEGEDTFKLNLRYTNSTLYFYDTTIHKTLAYPYEVRNCK